MAVVNADGKDMLLEYTAVSGVIYLTVDSNMLYSHIFDEHIKLQIVFNKHGEVRGNQDQIRDIKEENEPIPDFGICEGEDLSVSFDNGKDDDETVDCENSLQGAPSPLSEIGVDYTSQDREFESLDEAYVPKKRRTSKRESKRQKSSNAKLASKTDVHQRKETLNSRRRSQIVQPSISEVQKDHNTHKGKRKGRPRKGIELLAETSVSKKRKASKCVAMAKKRTIMKQDGIDNPGLENLKMHLKEKATVRAKRANRVTNSRRKPLKIDLEKDIVCQYCSKSFKSQREFRCHQMIQKKKYPCEKCNRTLSSQALLLIHMNEHEKKVSEVDNESKELKHAADKSDQSFSEDGLEGGRGRAKKCCICDKVMSNMRTLKSHVMAHTGEGEYKCCICEQVLLTHNTHKNHMRKHLKGTQFLCKICNTPFDSRGELATHQITHKYPCSLCGKEFPNKPTRNYHYRSFHKHDIMKCHLCDRLYSSEKALQSHLKRHRNRHETQCPICGQLFVRLKNHIERVHGNTSTPTNSSSLFICDKCPKQFPSKIALNCHLSSAHAAEKPYECPECSKTFASCGKLTRHMKIHLPDKPYVCEICGKACNRSSNLKIHMRTHKRSNSNVNFTPENVLQQQQMIPNPYFGGMIGNNTMNLVYK